MVLPGNFKQDFPTCHVGDIVLQVVRNQS